MLKFNSGAGKVRRHLFSRRAPLAELLEEAREKKERKREGREERGAGRSRSPTKMARGRKAKKRKRERGGKRKREAKVYDAPRFSSFKRTAYHATRVRRRFTRQVCTAHFASKVRIAVCIWILGRR